QFTDSDTAYNLNLDSDTFSPEEAFVFLNFRSREQALNGRPLIVAGAGLDLSRLAQLIEDLRISSSPSALSNAARPVSPSRKSSIS
ncbi:hypothetical protein ACXWRF_09065, partial [Streptococcus pyogenes]